MLLSVSATGTFVSQSFGDRQFCLTVFSATGTFASRCFGERHFCLTEGRREAFLPHSVSAKGSFSQSFGERNFRLKVFRREALSSH